MNNGGTLFDQLSIGHSHQLLEEHKREYRSPELEPNPTIGGREWRKWRAIRRIPVSTFLILKTVRNAFSSGGHSVTSRPVRIVSISLTYFLRRLNQQRPEERLISGRRVKAASSRLLDFSAILTACSTSSKVPGRREAKKSGNKLILC